jgi:heterodisulfide reductase subunit A2
MAATFNTGVILQHSAIQNHHINYDALEAFLKKFQSIKSIWRVNDVSNGSTDNIIQDIRQHQITRVIIAGYNTGFAMSGFTRILCKDGIAKENVVQVDFSQANGNDSPGHQESLLACAVYDIPIDDYRLQEKYPVRSETLVVGGGIAGIQAALEIADSQHKVYLVEKSGTIGGHMAMFDKTFPTLDCAACILTPKMVEVGQHPYIELITYSEVKSISGKPGDFQVSIMKKARRVNVKTCIGCGTCAEKCPGTAPSEFDAGTTMRKAIYIPFPQAVPNKYLIDAGSCRYVQTGKCGVCVKVCPVEGCINLDEQDEMLNLDVGNIVIATGFKPFDAKRIQQFGYGTYPNVVTSLEFERLVNASGPTEGHIRLRSQDKKGNWIFTPDSPQPSSIALIHCVGSRDENYNSYCSRVCCMYSLKLAHLIKEKLPEAQVFEYYIDMRAFGKGYEEFYERIKSEGIQIIRGRTAQITQQQDKLLLRTEHIIDQKISEQPADMVILAVGLEPGKDTRDLAENLGLSFSCDGWLKESDNLYATCETKKGGIYLAGVCQGPKDIPDTVAHASAAASRVIKNITMNEVYSGLEDLSAETIMQKAKSLSPLYETSS